MKTILFSFLIGSALTFSAFGQESEILPADDGLGFPLYVTVSLRGDLPGADEEMIPMGIMEKLVSQLHLARLDVDEVQSSERKLRFYAVFAFNGMSEFQQWYDSDATKKLLIELNDDDSSFNLAMDVKRVKYSPVFD